MIDVETFEIGDLAVYADALSDARARMKEGLRPCPASPPRTLSAPAVGHGAEGIERLLFPGAGGNAGEAVALAGLTIGDIVYSAASIDPNVIMAADFSRSKDLLDIFRFGEFADGLGGYSEGSLAGAESNLRGYVG